MCSKNMKTDKDLLSAMLLLLPSLVLLLTPVTADPLGKVRSNKTYTPNSPFENNLKGLLQSLSSNTHLTGFNSASVGSNTNQVHGRALCRGDVAAQDCKNCVENASQEIMKVCKSEEAIIWYEFCQVQYSYQMFSVMVYTGKYPDSNSQKKNVSDPGHFYSFQKDLMGNLTNDAAFDHAKLMFAVGETKLSRNLTIYGLVQCTRDQPGGFCSNCLMSAFGDLSGCCKTHEGGTILRSCNMRFEVHRFYKVPTVNAGEWKMWMLVLVICIPIFAPAVLIGSCILYRRGTKGTQNVAMIQEGSLLGPQELPFMDFATVKAATDNISDSNKLGQGGFGTVFNSKKAVKKIMARAEEVKNEIILIAKLQHRNLVRFLGCGIEGDEKLLIYEFMPNKSLDIFIFDEEKELQLNWETRHNIINGIARGLLYLHEDSRLKIIHRDLKPNNVLLDHDMVAKISDFGMARIFCEKQNAANTRRIVGTYGYMAPEYAMEGIFSVKSDAFSFGVILLEIISGKRNSGFYLTQLAPTLLAYAWRLWNEGKELEFVDSLLTESCPAEEILRCVHIGLLCVQEDPADRPTMSMAHFLIRSKLRSLYHASTLFLHGITMVYLWPHQLIYFL
ncbi:hypothetical protein AAG906_001876 [Vitis piasezkii]